MEYNKKYLSKSLRLLYEKTEKIDFRMERKLRIRTYYDATIIPGIGVYDSNGTFIDGTDLHEGKIHEYDKNIQISQIIDEAVYLGTFFYCWGHCITDNIKRMWIFLDNKYPIAKYLYSAYDDYPINDSFIKIMQYLIPANLEYEEIKSAVRVSKLIIPDPCIVTMSDGIHYHRYFIDLINKIKMKALQNANESVDSVAENDRVIIHGKGAIYISDIEKERRIYFSRRNNKTKCEFGNIELDNIFERAGFQIIYPEEWSLEEQISILNMADVFVVTEGSISHNAMFVNPQCIVVILKKYSLLNGYSTLIDNIIPRTPIYVDSNLSFITQRGIEYQGPFLIVINKYCSNMFCDYFGIAAKTNDNIHNCVKYLIQSAFVSKKKYMYNNSYDDVIYERFGTMGVLFPILTKIITNMAYYMRKTIDKMKRVLF